VATFEIKVTSSPGFPVTLVPLSVWKGVEGVVLVTLFKDCDTYEKSSI
jgi:hypothetical protein